MEIVFGVIAVLLAPPLLVVGLVQAVRKKKWKPYLWGFTGCLIVFVVCGIVTMATTPRTEREPQKENPQESSAVQTENPTHQEEITQKPVESQTSVSTVDGVTSDEVIDEIQSDGIVEKLMSFGFTEEEAHEQRKILIQCGIESIDICEPTDPNATIDGLVAFRGKIDKNRIFWFTVEQRKIFYIALNDEDLYDVDKGGFLKRFDEVHIPETYLDETEKYELRDLAESVLDKYFKYDVRYYDAWGFGREDDKYMAQCQISDGSILTDGWTNAYVWFERQPSGEFIPTGVKINGVYYEVK